MIPRRRVSAELSAKPRDPNAVAPLNFKKMFDEWVADTQKTWGHDRSKTLGGSEVFGCIRKAWYSRNKTPKDVDYEERWGALRRGDIIENHLVVPAMDHAAAKNGFKISYHGEDQNTLFADGYPLSVTPDGLLSGLPRDALSLYGVEDHGSDCCMLEIKSIDPRVDLAEEKAIHHGQTQIQMGLIRENTEFKPNYAVLLYINASFLDDMDVFVVKFDPEKYQIAKDRARLVYETNDPNLLMREGKIDGSCQYCPFQDACLNTTAHGMPVKDPEKKKKGKKTETDPALVDALLDLIDEKRAAGKAEEKAKKEHELIKERIRNTLREFGQNRAGFEDWTVSYSLAVGRKTLDQEAMAADGIDLESYMREGRPYDVLQVRFKQPKQDDL